ncbi:MAG: hypothetical protein SFV52_16080 [Saprospiraceae bacterium]|nr:hypothetical protein [Saprospiraceae bacterium]
MFFRTVLRLLTGIIGLMLTSGLTAQDAPAPNFCGYTGMSPWLEWYHDNKDQIAYDRGADTVWLYVPMTFHLVGNDDGSGYFPIDQAMEAVCSMNRMFEQAFIEFYLMPGDEFRYHNNTSWNVHDFTAGGQMIDANRLPGRLNCFIVKDPAGNCGYAWKDAIVLGKGCSGSKNKTWAHEAGHHFSLPHPFVGWEGEAWDFTKPAPASIGGRSVEKTDGTNCNNSADRFCDTRPDYLSDRWQCDPNKESSTIQRDPNNVQFRSDGSLIMGYSDDQCSDLFTPEQIAAMRNNLTDEHVSYLQTSTPGLRIPKDTLVQLLSPLDTAEVQYNNIVLSWMPVPNAQYYSVKVALTPTFGIVLMNANVTGTSAQVNVTVPANKILYWSVEPYSNWSFCGSSTAPQVGVFLTKNLSATNELERHAFAQLMPNPASGGSNPQLVVNSDENLDAFLVLHDAAGRTCYQQQLRIFNGENRIDIPTNQLENGLYTVSLQNELGRMVMRLSVVD